MEDHGCFAAAGRNYSLTFLESPLPLSYQNAKTSIDSLVHSLICAHHRDCSSPPLSLPGLTACLCQPSLSVANDSLAWSMPPHPYTQPLPPSPPSPPPSLSLISWHFLSHFHMYRCISSLSAGQPSASTPLPFRSTRATGEWSLRLPTYMYLLLPLFRYQFIPLCLLQLYRPPMTPVCALLQPTSFPSPTLTAHLTMTHLPRTWEQSLGRG